MVQERLRSLGLRFTPGDGVRLPAGRPPPARTGWELHLVASKRAGEAWPGAAMARIQAARACYDAGTHELVSCTTEQGWTQLYCRPRRVPVPQRSYFKTTETA